MNTLKKRILFTPSDNNIQSGAFRSMATLCSILQEKYGHDIIVVLPESGDGEELLDEFNVHHVLIRSKDWIKDLDKRNDISRVAYRKIVNVGAYFRLKQLVKKWKPDIIHLNTSWCYIGAIVAKHCEIPYVWHIREILEDGENKEIICKKQGYKLMETANLVIAISQSVFEWYRPKLNTDKLITVLNGVDPNPYKDESHIIFQNEAINCMIVGGIAPYKGQELLIRSLGEVKRRGFNEFYLRIIGSGSPEYIEYLNKLIIENGLLENIEFSGVIKNISEYYKTSDVVFICTKAEAFGRVAVEAMYAGDLVIGPDSFGIKELISDGRTGLIYKCGDYLSLADRFIYAIENKGSCIRISDTGRKYMLQNMTAEINVERINNAYQDYIFHREA